MNRKGFLAFSYVDLQSWIGFFFITVLAFLLFQTLIADPPQVDSKTLTIDTDTTLLALLNAPIDSTITTRDLLVRLLNEIGPENIETISGYSILATNLEQQLNTLAPGKLWSLVVTDERGVVKLLELSHPRVTGLILDDLAFVYLPTNLPEYQTIRVTLHLTEAP